VDDTGENLAILSPEIVANITMRRLKKKKSGALKSFKDKNVIEFTGPAVWTDSISII